MELQIKIITSDEERQQAYSIRYAVFVKGQGVPVEIEMDQFDKQANHVLAILDGKPVGTARWRTTPQGVKLERFAVLEAYRSRGVGAALVRFILQKVRHESKVYLHAQEAVVPFYEKYGFVPVGKPFDEVGIRHRKMYWDPTAKS